MKHEGKCIICSIIDDSSWEAWNLYILTTYPRVAVHPIPSCLNRVASVTYDHSSCSEFLASQTFGGVVLVLHRPHLLLLFPLL